jgi:hypothetical protein
VLQDQGRQDYRTDVIAEPTTASRPEALQAKITFRQDRMYFLSPFKLAIVESLPAYILGEEDRGHYIYSLATTIKGGSNPTRTLTSSHQHKNWPLEAVFPLY